MAIVELKNVSRVYTSGDHELKALDGVNLSLDEGKFVVILGPSGAGKSTLLNLLGGLDSPTSGTITVCGNDISTLTQNELADYRAETVGFVFQFYNLIPTLTVHENVTLVKEIVKNPLSATKMLEEAGEGDSTRGGPTREGYSTREGGVSDTRKRRVSQRREEYHKEEKSITKKRRVSQERMACLLTNKSDIHFPHHS